jgi:hypothetical protein
MNPLEASLSVGEKQSQELEALEAIFTVSGGFLGGFLNFFFSFLFFFFFLSSSLFSPSRSW